jgi:hypothetical protein
MSGVNRTFLHELLVRHEIDAADFRRGGAEPPSTR